MFQRDKVYYAVLTLIFITMLFCYIKKEYCCTIIRYIDIRSSHSAYYQIIQNAIIFYERLIIINTN